MFITHNDAQIFTVSFGKGTRTLLALGGWAGSWELWAQPFAELSQTWRAIAFDHRGTGSTLTPVESITLQHMVDDVFAVLDAYGIDQCVLAAESAGAAVALMAALQNPKRFNGLVIVDGFYTRPTPTQPEPFVEGLRHHFDATIAQFVDACLTEPYQNEYQNWGRQILGRCAPAAAIQLYECMYGVDLSPKVSQITQPTLIIHGEKDKLVPLHAAQWLNSQLPTSQLCVIPNSGHVPTITHPVEVANAINEYFVTLL